MNASPPNSDHSALSTQHSALDDEPGALAAVGALLLVAALVMGVFWAMSNPAGERLYTARQANALLSEGRYSEAAALLERALTRFDSPEIRLALSQAYLARRDAERAERQARVALSIAPPDLKPAAWAQLGRVFSYVDRPHEARDAWAEAVQAATPFRGVAPVEAEVRSALWHTAMQDWSNSRFDDARTRLESLLGGDDIYALSARTKLAQLLAPTSSDISHKHLEYIQHRTANIESAAVPDLRLPDLSEGLAPEVFTDTVSLLQQAYADADRARKEGVSEAGLNALWGRAFLTQGEPHLAKRHLEQAVQAQPNLADAHSYLALALLSTGDAEAALDHLQIAVALAPERPLPRYVLARLYIQTKDWDRAKDQLSALKRLEPDSPQMHVQLGEYYVARGAYDVAEDEYITAMEKQGDPGDTPGGLDAALALSRFYTDVRGLGCEKGLPAARRSLERNPGDPASLDAVGWSLVLCDKSAEALSSLERAVAEVPDSPRFRFHLGKAYALLDRPEDARTQFDRAMDLDPGGVWEGQAKAGIVGLDE